MLVTALLFTFSLAHAGVISGGGGGAFVCRDANKQVTKAELLDFWEAREISGLKLAADNNTAVDAQFNIAADRLARIDSGLADEVRKNYAFIQKNHVMAGNEVAIAPPNDANDRVFDANCPLEGMMFFDDQREKLVQKADAFQKLGSNTEVAGAYFHEALYKAMRDDHLDGGRDSVLTRIIVGCVFADGDPATCLNLSAIELPTDRKVWRCEIPAGPGESGLSFALYKENAGDEDWIFVPTRLGASHIGAQIQGALGKRPVTLPGMGGGPAGSGSFTLDPDSLRFTGMERLGLPWDAKKPPYGSGDFEIAAVKPLTLQHGDSERTYVCR